MGPKRGKRSEPSPDRWRAEPMVAEGTIRTPDDVDGLDVSIRIDVSRITMRSGENDLGTWPSGAVMITRIDDTRFAFVAEGDRLLFSPADVDAFAAHPGVIDDTGTKRPRKQRASRIPGAPSAGPESAPAPSLRPAPAAQAPERTTGSRFTRKRSVPVDQPTPGAGHPPDPRRKRGNGLWIRMIDLARPYSIFSLDRVPVDTRLRGQDHEHTWDHFAARSSGPSHHLCTICGKIRWR